MTTYDGEPLAELGARIARARRARGLTQKQLGVAVGLSPWAVDQLESGRRFSERHLTAIADAVGHEGVWLDAGSVSVESARETRRATTSPSRHIGQDLVLGAVGCLVAIRFFTEVIPILPRAANFVDIPIFLALGLASMFAAEGRGAQRRGAYLYPVMAGLGFLSLSVISAVINAGRVEPGPVLVFIYGFLSPVGAYAAVYRIWPAGRARSLSRVIVVLGLLQLAVVALVDVPQFVASGNRDVISGTLGTNAYQLVFFLLLFAALVAGIFTIEPLRPAARFAPVLIFGVFATVLLAQYRALIAPMVVALVVVAAILGRRGRGFAVAIVTAIAFVGAFSYIASAYPFLKLAPVATTLTHDPRYYVAQRLKAIDAVVQLYQDKPLSMLVGTGPGTFSSRAWATFAKAGSTSQSNVAGSYVRVLTGGNTYQTDVSTKYVQPKLSQGNVVQGSKAVTSPYSSYTSLMAEVGLGGFFLMIGFYVAATVRAIDLSLRLFRDSKKGDALPALALAAAIAFVTLLQMALLENWLEVTRVTFLAWMLLAVVSKEVDARTASS